MVIIRKKSFFCAFLNNEIQSAYFEHMWQSHVWCFWVTETIVFCALQPVVSNVGDTCRVQQKKQNRGKNIKTNVYGK